MSELADHAPAPLRDVGLQLRERRELITVADARQIAEALQRHLDLHPTTADGEPLPRIAGQPWIDSRNTVRVGTWMLGARGDRLVMTLRHTPQPGTTTAYVITAELERVTGGWHVPSVALTRVQYR